MSKIRQNPALYHELSAPFLSNEIAQAAIAEFYEDVNAARIKHKLANVLVVLSVDIASDDVPGVAMTTLNFGSSDAQECLAAFAYGQEKAIRAAAIAAMLAGRSRKDAK